MLVSICESTVLYIEYLHNIGNDWFIFSYFHTIKVFGGGINLKRNPIYNLVILYNFYLINRVKINLLSVGNTDISLAAINFWTTRLHMKRFHCRKKTMIRIKNRRLNTLWSHLAAKVQFWILHMQQGNARVVIAYLMIAVQMKKKISLRQLLAPLG